MKFWRELVAACALSAALGGAPAVLAAEPGSAPESKPPAKDLLLRGDARCTGCHDEADDPVPSMLELHPSVLAIGKTRHGVVADKRTPSCSDCHGESNDHVNYKGKDKPPKPDRTFGKHSKTPVQARNQSCLTCHQSGNRIAWQSGSHAGNDVACSSCHQVHAARDAVREKTTQAQTCYTCHAEQRAQMSRPNHHPVPEGKMTCSSCHNVHGDNPKMLAKNSLTDVCYTCHAEKRGPFVHNHQPVTEDCGICHNPHGTTTENLLKVRIPFLCQECHASGGHPQQAAGLPTGRTANTSLLGTVARGCTNCHVNIHGSNSTINSATAGRFRR